MLSKTLLPAVLISSLCLTTIAVPARASTVNSNRVDVTLQATILESLTVTIANPIIAFGTVTGGQVNTAPANQALAIVSVWNLNSGRTLKMYAYFDSATTALTGTLTGTQIPVSAMSGAFNGGAAQTFSATSPFGSGPALLLYTTSITSANRVSTRTDSLALTMDLTSMSNISADTYTGTMHVQAQAI